jgi:chromosome segregation ATPase
MDASDESVDSLSSLEERIHRAVQIIQQLRAENDNLQIRLKKAGEEVTAAFAQRDEAQQLCDEFQKETGDLEAKLRLSQEELQALRDERKQVKNRIEKLMGQLDLLSAS